MLGASRLCRRQVRLGGGEREGRAQQSPGPGGDPARARGWASVPQAASGRTRSAQEEVRVGPGGAVPEPGLRAAGR